MRGGGVRGLGGDERRRKLGSSGAGMGQEGLCGLREKGKKEASLQEVGVAVLVDGLHRGLVPAGEESEGVESRTGKEEANCERGVDEELE